MSPLAPGRSWSGTVDYGPGPLHAPSSVAELQSLVAATPRIRALGTRHSFSTIAASDGALVTLERMPADVEIDSAAASVRVAAGVRYGEVALAAWEAGFALANMGSLPHISVGGASATGTHGSGDANRVLAASVRSIEMVTAEGDLLELGREHDSHLFGGAVLALGALGVVTHLTLDLVPAFSVRQSVYLDLPSERMTSSDLQAVLGGAYSVSLFHHWEGHISQAWMKQRVRAEPESEPPPDGTDGPGPLPVLPDGPDDGPLPVLPDGPDDGPLPSSVSAPLPSTWFGARLALDAVHPLPGMPADFCTDQSGAPGPFYERLPHFRMEFTPSNGAEIQSEYLIAREDVAEALAAVMPLGERIRPLLHASEVRTVAADELWLSPAHRRDSAGVHFTWKQMPREVEAMLPEIEERLEPFSPRPHWGKVFTLDPETVRERYPRLPEFLALRDRLDPDRTFTNAFVDRVLGR